MKSYILLVLEQRKNSFIHDLIKNVLLFLNLICLLKGIVL